MRRPGCRDLFRLDSGRWTDAWQVATALSAERGTQRWRRKLAWLAPVLVAGGVVTIAAVASATPSTSVPALPTRSAAQLLTAMQGAVDTALSGQISETANLGIPSLPGDRSTASLSWQTFVAGTHSARVWVDGPQRQRFALLGELSEADVVHNGRDLWTYTSDTNTVTHSVVRTTGAATPQLPRTPAALSAQLLKAVAPSTSVGVGPSRVVAGRTAYTLVIAPRDARSTIRRIIVAVDSRRFVPLQVQIFGGSASPALRIGFTKISFTRPAVSTFRFTVPRGAAVSSNPLSADRHHETATLTVGMFSHTHPPRPAPPPGSSVADGRPSSNCAAEQVPWSGGLPDGLGQAGSTVPGSSARLLHTALVNAVITGDGRVFVGAIQPALLEHVAATTTN